MKDFTLTAYTQLLLALKNAGYVFYTFEEWCDDKATGKYVILRHDVDLKAGHSLATAQIEANFGIVASYYFRVVPKSNQPEIIKAIADLGHEIGYHYEDLAICNGDTEAAINHFENQLVYFRTFYPVRTICMHGSPTSKWDNREIWKTNDYHHYGIIGEPYFDFLNLESNGFYLTDTGRMWDGEKYNIRDKSISSLNSQPDVKHHSTFDLIHWLTRNSTPEVLMITTHPQRWTDKNYEWIIEYAAQSVKNIIKQFLSK